MKPLTPTTPNPMLSTCYQHAIDMLSAEDRFALHQLGGLDATIRTEPFVLCAIDVPCYLSTLCYQYALGMLSICCRCLTNVLRLPLCAMDLLWNAFAYANRLSMLSCVTNWFWMMTPAVWYHASCLLCPMPSEKKLSRCCFIDLNRFALICIDFHLFL